MKINTLLLPIVFLVAVNFCQGQTKSQRQGLRFLGKGIILSHRVAHEKITTASQSSIVTAPLMLKTRSEEQTDLFSQLINWDCKLKVKLNSNFNFVLSYN